MDNPFAMSFEDLKNQAEANMKTDKQSAQPAGAGQKDPAPAVPKQASTPQAAAEGKSFLDIVDETQRRLAQENAKAGSQAVQVEETTQAAGQAISFDNVQQQNSQSASVPSFEDMFAQAKGPANTQISFDDMFAQAQNNAQPAEDAGISFDAMAAQAQPSAEVNTASNAPAEQVQQAAGISFDELMAQAQASTDASTALNAPIDPAQPSTDTGISFDAVAAQANIDTKAKEDIQAPADTDTKAKEDDQANTDKPAKAEAPAKAEKPKKVKESKGKKQGTKKEEAQGEPLPDTTDDYKVDLAAVQPGNTKLETQPAGASALSMDSLFTPKELASFRADIHAIIAHEFKQALVGVTKEFLNSLCGKDNE